MQLGQKVVFAKLTTTRIVFRKISKKPGVSMVTRVLGRCMVFCYCGTINISFAGDGRVAELSVNP